MVLTDIKYPDGTPFECDARQVLRQAQSDMKKLGYSVKIGTECEFYLLKQDEEGLPTKTPHDNASYMDIAPLDKGENVRRQICRHDGNIFLRAENITERQTDELDIVLHDVLHDFLKCIGIHESS